jgi:hypothetical protein
VWFVGSALEAANWSLRVSMMSQDHKTQTVLPSADTAAMLFWFGDV